MDAFFDSADAAAQASPAHTSSPPASISLDDMPPHVTSFPSPTGFTPQEFDVKSEVGFYSSSDAYSPEDYPFAPSSAPELSHVELVNQEISSREVKLESESGYWSPSQATPTATTSTSNSFLSDLYNSTPMAVSNSNNGVSPEALTNSGPSSPTWSDGAQESQPTPSDHVLLRRASCPSWEPHQPSRDEVLPPVSALLFDYPRQAAISLGDSRRFDLQADAHPFELRPVIYSGEPTGYAGDTAAYQTHNLDEHYMRNDTYGPIDWEPKSNGSAVIGGLSMAHNVPIMHTDDAASKETQYLRRRCFNCRATEPPSWRRSTLNPGKIVCNKCGLYERTHLRPRPHRFDELRGGAGATKSRKASKSMITGMPSQGKGSLHIRPDANTMHRRASMASMTSTASSEAWEEYTLSSSSPSPPFNSPTTLDFPQGVQQQGPINLPQPPMLPRPRVGGRKLSASALPLRAPWSPTESSFAAQQGAPRRTLPAPHDYFSRRGSFDVASLSAQRRQHIPIETGWQTIPLEDVRPRNGRSKPSSLPSSRPVAAA